MITITDWLIDATGQLIHQSITSARLDAQLLLAHAYGRTTAWLIAHGDEPIDDTMLRRADALLTRRLKRVPIAYLTHHKEFYGRMFVVDETVLIPRPESEDMIDLLKGSYITARTSTARLIDVGTGSGCLGITAKLELPLLSVTLSDVSRDALKIAEENARSLHANVTCLRSNLLASTTGMADVVIANLPYVDPRWERSPETDHEPSLALFASDHGLGLIKRLIAESEAVVTTGGYLLLEADPCQHADIVTLARTHGFLHRQTMGYALSLQKTTIASRASRSVSASYRP